MVLYSNIALEANTPLVFSGTRTLEIHNNTDLQGKVFRNVFVFFQKRSKKSIVAISNDREPDKNAEFVFGLFVGEDFKPIKGCRFEGSAKTNDGRRKIGVFNPDGEVEWNGTRYIIVQGIGWLEKSCAA